MFHQIIFNQSVSRSLVGRCFSGFLAKHHTIFRHSSCLCCCFSQSQISCSHRLIGLPLPLLPVAFASSMCFSSDSWRLMCPKYPTFSNLISCSSVVEFILTFYNTFSFVTLSVHIVFNNIIELIYHLLTVNPSLYANVHINSEERSDIAIPYQVSIDSETNYVIDMNGRETLSRRVLRNYSSSFLCFPPI